MDYPLPEKISVLMMRKNRNLKRLYSTFDTSLKLSSAACLFVIRNSEGGCSATTLRDSVCYDKAFISRTLSELTADGYITRNPEDDEKQRGFRYILSDRGEKYIEQVFGISEKVNAKLLQGITKEELEVFMKVSTVFIDNLKQLADEREKMQEDKTKNA